MHPLRERERGALSDLLTLHTPLSERGPSLRMTSRHAWAAAARGSATSSRCARAAAHSHCVPSSIAVRADHPLCWIFYSTLLSWVIWGIIQKVSAMFVMLKAILRVRVVFAQIVGLAVWK